MCRYFSFLKPLMLRWNFPPQKTDVRELDLWKKESMKVKINEQVVLRKQLTEITRWQKYHEDRFHIHK